MKREKIIFIITLFFLSFFFRDTYLVEKERMRLQSFFSTVQETLEVGNSPYKALPSDIFFREEEHIGNSLIFALSEDVTVFYGGVKKISMKGYAILPIND
jgi:hypothetical protein